MNNTNSIKRFYKTKYTVQSLIKFIYKYIVGWMQERSISAPGWRTTYLGARSKNDLSRRPVEERPISAPDSRTTYLKRDFRFSDFVVAALHDFKIRLL